MNLLTIASEVSVWLESMFCQREHNGCKKRNKCHRYTFEPEPDEKIWYFHFWDEYGKECKKFVEREAI